jgi:hypothetical protein
MIGHLSLEEQIEVDFSRARRKALLWRVRTRLRGDAAPDGLLCFDEVRKNQGVAVGRVYRGVRTVPVAQLHLVSRYLDERLLARVRDRDPETKRRHQGATA